MVFLQSRSLGSKRGIVKPPFLIEIKITIGTLLHFQVHHGPDTGEIALKLTVYIVCNICDVLWRCLGVVHGIGKL